MKKSIKKEQKEKSENIKQKEKMKKNSDKRRKQIKKHREKHREEEKEETKGSVWDSLTKEFEETKTLKFELKPVGETKRNLSGFKNQYLKTSIYDDVDRAEKYVLVKKYITRYHKHFIEKCLIEKDFIIKHQIDQAFALYKKIREYKQLDKKELNKEEKKRAKEENDKNKKEFSAMQKELRNQIGKKFKKAEKEYCLFDDSLINNKKEKKAILLQYYERLYELGKEGDESGISEEEWEEINILIESFQRFASYFTGYNDSRKNMYSDEEKSSSIAYRIFHDNMPKFFENCLRFEETINQHPNLKKSIDSCTDLPTSYEKYFKPDSFFNFLSQNEINDYNTIICGATNTKGINSIINEYCQINKIDNKTKMTKLFKQILGDKSVVVNNIQNDGEMFEYINKFFDVFFDCNYVNKIKALFRESLNDDVYIKASSLSNISHVVFDDWSLLSDALKLHAEKFIKYKTKKEKWLKKKSYSLGELNDSLKLYKKEYEKDFDSNILVNYFCSFKIDKKDILENIEEAYRKAKDVLSLEALDSDRREKSENDGVEGLGSIQIDKLRNLFDSMLQFFNFISPFSLFMAGKEINVHERNRDFHDSFDEIYSEITDFYPLYNNVRNHITKKPYCKDKVKLNFNSPSFGKGWDVNKEVDHNCFLIRKNNNYYLMIINKNKKENNHIFDYIEKKDDNEKKIVKKQKLADEIIATEEDDYYEKMVYKYMAEPSKMLPKVFFAKNNIEFYKPSKEILNISKKGLYKKEAKDKKSMCKLIDFYKECLLKHPEWGNFFDFNFSDTNDYEDCSEFFNEVKNQGYKVAFHKIKSSYVDEKIKNNDIFMFQIYSKDFSEYSKGKPNDQTSYFRFMFSEENLKNTILKLNGSFEMFYRPFSLDKDKIVVHRKNESIKNKNKLNHKKTSLFDFDIIKDRRFSEDKFLIHIPININYAKNNKYDLNKKVNNIIKNKKDINIIGIDRGERNLVYFSIINQKGDILKEGSLNTIVSKYNNEGKVVEIKNNYYDKIKKVEKARHEAKKSWKEIKKIKDIKEGYIGHVVHEIIKLAIKYNAIIVLEDLGVRFKKSRSFIETQIYQKFEKALVKKLNYLTFKDNKFGDAGHYLNGYQLSNKHTSEKKKGKQNGILSYVSPSYTSKIDPVTGYVCLIFPKYKSIKVSKQYINLFDEIKYNSSKDYFEFSYDENNFDVKFSYKRSWTVCSCGKERFVYNPKQRKSICLDVTEELKNLLDKNNINYKSESCLISDIVDVNSSEFFKSLLYLIGAIMQLRYKNQDVDYILSPIKDKEGEFFDSRKLKENLPINSDSNGAYNIARKGLYNIIRIHKNEEVKYIYNDEWFSFVDKF